MEAVGAESRFKAMPMPKRVQGGTTPKSKAAAVPPGTDQAKPEPKAKAVAVKAKAAPKAKR